MGRQVDGTKSDTSGICHILRHCPSYSAFLPRCLVSPKTEYTLLDGWFEEGGSSDCEIEDCEVKMCYAIPLACTLYRSIWLAVASLIGVHPKVAFISRRRVA